MDMRVLPESQAGRRGIVDVAKAAVMPGAGLAFVATVATGAYLGLAILGRGGFSAFFSHPALVALALAVVILSGVSLFSGGNLSPGEREDRANRWVLAAFGLLGLLLAYLPAYTVGMQHEGATAAFVAGGAAVVGGCSADFARFLGADFRRWGAHWRRRAASSG
jgi:hypothetical protein